MPLDFECTENASAKDLEEVDAGISQYNLTEPEIQKVIQLSVFAREDPTEIRGGAVGRTWGQCCELQQLWIAEQARGQRIGTELMDRFENEAQRRGCTLVYLDTFTFQARPFYEKRGYQVVFETQGFTNGIVKYTMHKRLEAAKTEA